MKRARAAKIHAHIVSHLKKEMPAMMGKSKAQRKLIENLGDEFVKVTNSLLCNPFALGLVSNISNNRSFHVKS